MCGMMGAEGVSEGELEVGGCVFLEHVCVGDGGSAYDTGFAAGIGHITTGWTLGGLNAHFAVDFAVSGVDFEDFCFEMIVFHIDMVTEDLPHGLAGEGEAIVVIFELCDGSSLCVGFIFGFVGGGFIFPDFSLLIDIPDHDDVGYHFIGMM